MPKKLLTDLNVRAVVRADLDALRALIRSVDLFPEDALEPLSAPYLDGADEIWLVAEAPDGALVGLAYCRPEEMADRTWNLLALGVAPDHRRVGLARALIEAVERAAIARRARLLLVETSGDAAFEAARRLYSAVGFSGEARIPDFWADGADKVSFWKPLTCQRDGASPETPRA